MKIVFGIKKSKKKVSVKIENHVLWRKVKARAWKKLSETLNVPVAQLKKQFVPMKNHFDFV